MSKRYSNEEVFAIVKKNLLNIVDGVDPDAVARDRSMKDLGANSLDIVEVVSVSMRELKVRVPRSELAKLRDIGGLVDLLHRVLEEKAASETPA